MSRIETVKLDNVHATQRTISSHFTGKHTVSVDALIPNVSKVPTIVVLKEDGLPLQTFNNRRLYAFRKSKVEEIHAVTVKSAREISEFNATDFRLPENLGKHISHTLRLIHIHVGFLHDDFLYVLSWPALTAGQLCKGVCASQDKEFPMTGRLQSPEILKDPREITYLIRVRCRSPLSFEECLEKLYTSPSIFVTLNMLEEASQDGITKYNFRKVTEEVKEWLKEEMNKNRPGVTLHLDCYKFKGNHFRAKMVEAIGYRPQKEAKFEVPERNDTNFPSLSANPVNGDISGSLGGTHDNTEAIVDQIINEDNDNTEAFVDKIIYEDIIEGEHDEDEETILTWTRGTEQDGGVIKPVRGFPDLKGLGAGESFKSSIRQLRVFDKQYQMSLRDEHYEFPK